MQSLLLKEFVICQEIHNDTFLMHLLLILQDRIKTNCLNCRKNVTGVPFLGDLHILMDTLWLVEDDKVQQFIVKKLVTQTAVVKNLELFSNGEEAYHELLNCISQNKPFPGTILLDINMPVLDAWGFLDKITALNNLAVN